MGVSHTQMNPDAPKNTPCVTAQVPGGLKWPRDSAAIIDRACRTMRELSHQLYEELRGIAAALLRGERVGHTLQSTALVHEAILKLRARFESTGTIDDSAFIAASSQAMRRILVDHARTRNRLKRGDPSRRADVELDLLTLPSQSQPPGLDELDAALVRLAEVDPEAAKIVELRFFGGFSVDQAAELMTLSPRSAARLWQFARAWLATELLS